MRWTVGAAGLLIFLFQKTNPLTGSAATEALLAWPTESGSGAPQRPAASGSDLRYRRQENMNVEKSLNNVDALRRRLEVCTKGRYIVLNSSSTCRDCPNGQFGNTQNCRGISCCKACTKGQYAPQQDKGCELCEKGMYQENDVAQEYQCKRCSNDLEYVSTVSACRECSSGRYSNATPVGLGESPCSICPMGKTTGKLTGQTSCFPICTESLQKAADVPCVPAKNNKSNPCTYGDEYFNNSKELRSDENEYERCEPCDKLTGVNCTVFRSEQRAPNLDELVPLVGFFNVPWQVAGRGDADETWRYEPRSAANSLFVRCPFAASCLQTGCSNTTHGPLCALCDAYHYRADRMASECEKCVPGHIATRSGIFIGVCLIVFGLGFLIFTRSRKIFGPERLAKLSNRWRSIVRVLSICINYLQICSSLPSVIKIDWSNDYLSFVDVWSFVNVDIVDILGLECLGTNSFDIHAKVIITASGLLIVASSVWFVLKCRHSALWRRHRRDDHSISHLRKSAAQHLFETVDVDANGHIDSEEFKFLLRMIHFDMVQHRSKAAKKGSMNNALERVARAKRAERKISLKSVDTMTKAQIETMMKRIGARVDRIGVSAGGSGGSGRDGRFGGKGDKGGWEPMPTLVLSREKFLQAVEDPYTRNIFGTEEWVVYGEMHRLRIFHLTVLLTLCFSIAHAPVSRQFLNYVQCRNVGGKWYVVDDYRVLCQGEQWGYFAFFTWLLVISYTLMLPLVITIQLCRHRKSLHTPSVRRQYGFMYDRFVEGAEFWEVIDVVRKLVLMGLTGFLLAAEDRVFACTVISILAFSLLAYIKPHRNKTVMKVEMLNFGITAYKYVVTFYALAHNNVASSMMVMVLVADIFFLCTVGALIVRMGLGECGSDDDAPHIILSEKSNVSSRGAEGRQGNKEKHGIARGEGKRTMRLLNPRGLTRIVSKAKTDHKIRAQAKRHDESLSALNKKVEVDMTAARRRLFRRLEKKGIHVHQGFGEGFNDSDGKHTSTQGNNVLGKLSLVKAADRGYATATALHDFQGTHLSNIPLSKGDIVKVLGKDQNGWIHVEAGDATGQVPTAYLEFD